jgi:hypothetical protein
MRRRWRRLAPLGAAIALGLSASAGATPASIDAGELSGSGAVWDAEAGYTYGVGGGPCTSSEVGFTPAEEGSVGPLGDAFDGGLFLLLDRVAFDDDEGSGDLRAELQQLTIGPTKIGRLRVTRTDRALPDTPTLRSLVRLENKTSRDVEAEITWDSATGQDGTERTVLSDAPKPRRTTPSDDWIVAHGTTDEGGAPDPAITMAVYGPGDVGVTSRRVPWAPEDDEGTSPNSGCVVFRFDVKVPAGQTRFLLFFTELRGTADEAVATAARFGRVRRSSPLMDGIGLKVARRIANWDL